MARALAERLLALNEDVGEKAYVLYETALTDYRRLRHSAHLDELATQTPRPHFLIRLHIKQLEGIPLTDAEHALLSLIQSVEA